MFSFPTPGEAFRYRAKPSSVLGFPPATLRGPAEVAGCEFWVVAKDVADYTASTVDLNIFSVSAKTGYVDLWRDRIKGNNLTASGNSRPFFRADSIAGVDKTPSPCITYLTSQSMSSAYTLVSRNRCSIFFVAKFRDIATIQYLVVAGGINLIFAVQNGTLKFWNGASLVATTHRPPTNVPVAIVVSSGPNGVSVYLDSDLNKQTLSAITAAGGTVAVGGSSFNMTDMYECAIWPRPITDSETRTLMRYSSERYGTGAADGRAIKGRVVFDGDSLTQGTGSTLNRCWPQRLGVADGWLGHSFGVSGQTLATMITNQAVNTSPLASSSNWLFLYGGYNDLSASATGATVEGRINTYCTAAIAAGYPKSQIVVFTLSGSLATITERDNANTLIRANYTTYAGYLVDVAADSRIGCTVGGGFVDSSYAYDGVHLNDKGYLAMVELIRSTIALPF